MWNNDVGNDQPGMCAELLMSSIRQPGATDATTLTWDGPGWRPTVRPSPECSETVATASVPVDCPRSIGDRETATTMHPLADHHGPQELQHRTSCKVAQCANICQTECVTETSLGRRDRKREATHQSLRAAALRLGAERGVQHVTVEEIANEADVSVRTFYDHFSSKQDAVIGFDEWRITQLRDALRTRPAHESPRVALRAVLRELLVESSAEWPLRMKAVASDPAMLPHMFASFVGYERAIVEVIAERTGLDPTLDLFPTLLTTVASGAFRATMTIWRANAGAVDLLSVFDDAFANLARGLGWRSPTGGTHDETTSC